MKTKTALMFGGLLAASVVWTSAASPFIINGDFSDYEEGWTVSGSNQLVLPFLFGTPPDASTPNPTPFVEGQGIAIFNGQDVLIRTGINDDFATPPPATTATRLSQRIHIGTISMLPGKLGREAGRLRMSTYRGIDPSAKLSFRFQLLTNEITPGLPADFFRAQLGDRVLAFLSASDPSVNQPGSRGFAVASDWREVESDVSSLFGRSETLSFIVSDTVDALVDTGAVIDDVRLDYRYVVEDGDAIDSFFWSGLPMALAQRQIVQNIASNANRDVNARLFRFRSRVTVNGAPGPTGDGKAMKESKDVLPPDEKRWEFFVAGNYGYRDVETRGAVAGFDTDVITATVGAEYKVTPNFRIGAAATRVESENDLGALGNVDVEGYSFAAYVSVFVDNFYADLLYSLGTYNQQIHRNTGFGRTATARPDSLTNSLQFNTGYNIPLGSVVTGPFASLDWVHGDMDGYTEQRGGGANLVVDDQDFDSLISHIGWQASLPVSTSFGMVVPQVRAGWVHEYLDDNERVGAGLATSPYYLVNGTNVSRIGGFRNGGNAGGFAADYLSLGVGVGFQFGDSATLVLDYESRLLQDDSIAHMLSLVGSLKF